MPYSFTEIEKDKSKSISIAFGFLVLIYAGAILGIALLIKNYSYFEKALLSYDRVAFQWFDWTQTALIIVLAMALGAVHWLWTITGLTERITGILKAQDPDPADASQKMFMNIIEEVRAATGGSPIRGMVIPSMALNACAFGDGKDVPVIAVTKGLLYKLNRSQLEGVVAHEAAHVISEDYLGTTIISSMFEIFAAVLRGVDNVLRGMTVFVEGNSWHSRPEGRGWRRSGWDSDDRGAGGLQFLRFGYFIFFIVIIIVIAWIVKGLAALMRMFVSREREFRADAIAARLTRYPMGLAEALYIIRHHRHGLLGEGDSLATLFIINPAFSIWDEGEGFFSELFSTHPPTDKRVAVLLSMAGRSETELQDALIELQAKEEAEIAERRKQYNIENAPPGLWLAKSENGWVGPVALSNLIVLDWVTPQTIVKQVGQTVTFPLSQMPLYVQAIRNTPQKINRDPAYICPACQGELQDIRYEDIGILKCRQCEGVLLNEDSISPILQRKMEVFDRRIEGMARTLLNEPKLTTIKYLDFQESDRSYSCEQCRQHPSKWRKGLFNRYYHVEVDKCVPCGRIWFDKDELEVMQCMYQLREKEQIRPGNSA